MEKQKFFSWRLWLLLLLLMPLTALAQNVNVNGLVKNQTGELLVGVTIQVKGATSVGTITDLDGRFSLSVPKNATLVFSYVGFQTQEVAVKGQKELEVVLDSDFLDLDDVVVVAYGQQKKVTVTGSMSNINGKELLKSPAISLGNAISGKLPGVATVQYSGAPGADDPVINIRGRASFNGTDPLVLVDGVERSFTQIDPNEVADITVLKDASATAVYGVRGANGVILVTTKRGEAGATNISASTAWGIQTITNFIEFADSYTYATVFNAARLSDGNAPRFSDEVIEHFRTGDSPILYPSIKWTDYIMKDYALQSQHNISVSGGNDVARYFVSVGMVDQDGMFKTFGEDPKSNFSYQRYNFRSNLDINLGRIHELSLNLGGRIENKRTIGGGENNLFRYFMSSQPFAGAGIVDGKWIKSNPTYIFMDASGSINRDGLDTFYGQGYDQLNTNVLSLDLIYKLNLDDLTKGLSFHVKGAYNSTYYHQKNRYCGQPAKYMPIVNKDGEIVYHRTGDYWNLGYNESAWPDRNWYAEAGFDYNRSFGGHNVGALLLYNQSKYYYPWDSSGLYNSIPKGYVGLVGRVTYDYRHRYMVDFNMGYNGSENFAKGKRYGLFPSASIGWAPSEEKWWEPMKKAIPFLKLRASYGTVGNDNCQGYRFLYLPAAWRISGGYYNNPGDYSGYNFGTTNENFLNVARESSAASPDVTWETAQKYNAGIDAKFWGGRIGVNVDFFKEKRSDILINNENMITGPSALRPSYINYGKVENHGYEITLNFTDRIRDFYFNISPSVSFARNKVLEQAEIKKADKLVKANSYIGQMLGLTEDSMVSPDWTYRTGKPMYSRLGYKFFEFYEEGATEQRYRDAFGTEMPTQLIPKLMNGDAVYVDLDGDGMITEECDQIYDKYTDLPEYTFSLNAYFQYKNFDFSMLWSAATHVTRDLNGVYRQPFGQMYNDALLQWVADNAWTPEHPDAKLPRITFANEKQNQAGSELWYHDAKYLRLKNAEIGYNLPHLRFISKSASLRIYLNGTNLLTFSPLTANDPENKGGGYNDFIKYPLMRVFNLGAKLNF